MIKTFDKSKASAHDDFQTWRRRHPEGLFVNCRTENEWMLHRSLCPHHGDTEWRAGRKGWGNLTKNPKLCGSDVELSREAAQRGAALKRCRDCM